MGCLRVCEFFILFAVTLPLFQAKGTTRNIKEIFLGRCYEYQKFVNPQVFVNNARNCTELWGLFSKAFLNKQVCNVSSAEYADFADKASHEIPENKALFWSGVYPLVKEYSNLGSRYTTLADTLLGFLVDSLNWCGKTASPGINYETCPTYCNVNDKKTFYYKFFWDVASTQFAKFAKGRINVMLNGSRSDGAFRKTSIFAKVEIPLLKPPQVTHAEVWVVHNPGMKVIERCGEGSLVTLQHKIESKGIKYSCQDDPPEIKRLMCVDSEVPSCKLVSSVSAATSVHAHYVITMFIILFAVLK